MNLQAHHQPLLVKSCHTCGQSFETVRAKQRLCSSCRRVSLTPRESQIVERIAQGKTNKEIANDLEITVGTVKTYLSHVFDKLKLDSRLKVALYVLGQQRAQAG